MKLDIAQKRGAFIGKVNGLLQEFHNVSSGVFMRLMNSYALCIYGSNLWDIFSSDCERLYTSYNVAIRNILKVDRCTYRYLIEPLPDSIHLKTMIQSRYVSFYKSLRQCNKLPVRFLAHIYVELINGLCLGEFYELLQTCVILTLISYLLS